MCGDADWDREFDLSLVVAQKTPYYVIGEAEDGSRITTLDLLGVRQVELRTSVRLCDRLKRSWRKIKNDRLAQDGPELVVSFELPENGPNSGAWMFYRTKRQMDPAARKCKRHLWAVPAGALDRNLFAAAHLMPCSCKPECAVCKVAETFSLARVASRTGIDMTQHVALRDAVSSEMDEDAYFP